MEKEFKELVKVLREAKRRGIIGDFALTGALALSALTQPRATRDMDFLVLMEKEKIPFFVDWLKHSQNYNLAKHHAGRSKDRIKNLIEIPSGSARADLIAAFYDVEKEAVATAITASLYRNVKLKIIRPEYLIILKLFAGSEQDIIDGAHLWNEKIDRRLVRKMAKELFVEGKLKKLEIKARRV